MGGLLPGARIFGGALPGRHPGAPRPLPPHPGGGGHLGDGDPQPGAAGAGRCGDRPALRGHRPAGQKAPAGLPQPVQPGAAQPAVHPLSGPAGQRRGPGLLPDGGPVRPLSVRGVRCLVPAAAAGPVCQRPQSVPTAPSAGAAASGTGTRPAPTGYALPRLQAAARQLSR